MSFSSDTYSDVLTKTPQSDRIPGEDQIQNNAGGFVYELDKWSYLDRFLILGTESPTYYASSRTLSTDAIDNVIACIKQDAQRVVDRVVDISTGGRAPKNSPAIFVLALVAAKGKDTNNPGWASAAYEAVNSVCRIGTHLFEFAENVKKLKGLGGSGLRRALQRWYTDKESGRLAYQVLKYQQRNGWSHRDILRLAKPNVEERSDHDKIFAWATGKSTSIQFDDEDAQRLFMGYGYAKRHEDDPKALAEVIREHRLVRELVPTAGLQHAEVWQALLDSGMPMHALVRNLGKLTSVGLLKPMGNATREVVQQLTNEDAIRKSRLHPIAILNALKMYSRGEGFRGSLSWTPAREIIDAMDDAFVKSFDYVEPTNQRHYLGIDVSGSMGMHEMSGFPALSPREGAAAMAMAIARTESCYVARGFSDGQGSRLGYMAASRGEQYNMVDLDISARDSLRDVISKTDNLPFRGTDCALPMLNALQDGIEVDCFVVITDNETWFGDIHPVQALKKYRQETGINAKLVVIGMTATNFTIADPNDAGSLDIVGFDAAAPRIISSFAQGEF